jgi:hypothetical protein
VSVFFGLFMKGDKKPENVAGCQAAFNASVQALGRTETSIALGTDSGIRGFLSAARPAESQAASGTTADDSSEKIIPFFLDF